MCPIVACILCRLLEAQQLVNISRAVSWTPMMDHSFLNTKQYSEVSHAAEQAQKICVTTLRSIACNESRVFDVSSCRAADIMTHVPCPGQCSSGSMAICSHTRSRVKSYACQLYVTTSPWLVAERGCAERNVRWRLASLAQAGQGRVKKATLSTRRAGSMDSSQNVTMYTGYCIATHTAKGKSQHSDYA